MELGCANRAAFSLSCDLVHVLHAQLGISSALENENCGSSRIAHCIEESLGFWGLRRRLRHEMEEMLVRDGLIRGIHVKFQRSTPNVMMKPP